MTFTPIANSEFGEEINPGVEISQQDSQGNVRNYKVFYSETGGTTVRAVDANGQLLQNVEPIYKDGVWDQSKLTKNIELPSSPCLPDLPFPCKSDLLLSILSVPTTKRPPNFLTSSFNV